MSLVSNVLRRLAPALIAVALCGAFPAAANAAFSQQDKDDLARISAYLNSITTLTGKFTQVSSNGSYAEGTFYMKKPGRLRFEYAPPVPLLIVADGVTVAVTNNELETQDRYPLGTTPLSILLDDDLDLADDEHITRVERKPGQIAVTASESDGPAQGEITLVFSDPGLELRHWIVKDAQGQQVIVAISDLKRGVEISAAQFKIVEVNKLIPHDD